MRFLFEDINKELSIQAKELVKDYPELENRLREFESEWGFSGDLLKSKEAADFVSEGCYLHYEFEDDVWHTELDNNDFSEPEIIEIGYYFVDGKLGIEATIRWYADNVTVYGESHDYGYYEPIEHDEREMDFVANACIEVEIPEDLQHGDYITHGDDDIEYEVQ